MRRRALTLLALLAPSAAQACAVCQAANSRNRAAFLGTTILLSLLPLAMIAGGLWWLRRNSRALAGEDLAERDAVAPAPARPAVPGLRGIVPPTNA